MQKVDKIVGTLVEGGVYLVPVIEGSLGGTFPARKLPVIGNRHYDVEFFGNHMPHYHLDIRFMSFDEWQFKYQREIAVGVGRLADGSIPKPHYEEMACRQNLVIINNVRGPQPGGEEKMHAHFLGAKSSGSRETGWRCPHKGTFLGSQPAVAGVITCPAHGLRICEATGVVLK